MIHLTTTGLSISLTRVSDPTDDKIVNVIIMLINAFRTQQNHYQVL